MPERPSFESVADLLAEVRREPRETITPATRLREDLQIMGDDWDDVLATIEKRWPMDWTGFEFLRYFEEEPNLLSIYRAFSNLITGHRLTPITVGHLALTLERGKWFEPGSGNPPP